MHTRTLNPLHFEDMEPHRFEDMVRQLAYDFRTWKSIVNADLILHENGV